MLTSRRQLPIDLRKFKRYPLIYQLSVFNYDTNQFIGYLIDISTEGGFLVSESFIPAGIRIKLRLIVPTAEFTSEDYLDIEVETIRANRDINIKYFATGLRFLNITPQNKEIIKYLINEYGF